MFTGRKEVMVAVVEIVEALDKVNVVYERTMPDVRKCTKDSVGRRSETFTGSKEVAVVEAVEALDKVDVDVLWRMSRGDERGLIFGGYNMALMEEVMVSKLVAMQV